MNSDPFHQRDCRKTVLEIAQEFYSLRGKICQSSFEDNWNKLEISLALFLVCLPVVSKDCQRKMFVGMRSKRLTEPRTCLVFREGPIQHYPAQCIITCILGAKKGSTVL